MLITIHSLYLNVFSYGRIVVLQYTNRSNTCLIIYLQHHTIVTSTLIDITMKATILLAYYTVTVFRKYFMVVTRHFFNRNFMYAILSF